MLKCVQYFFFLSLWKVSFGVSCQQNVLSKPPSLVSVGHIPPSYVCVYNPQERLDSANVRNIQPNHRAWEGGVTPSHNFSSLFFFLLVYKKLWNHTTPKYSFLCSYFLTKICSYPKYIFVCIGARVGKILSLFILDIVRSMAWHIVCCTDVCVRVYGLSMHFPHAGKKRPKTTCLYL